MKTTGRTILLKGKKYTMTSESWWLENAIQLENNDIEIARVSAISDEKYRSEEERALYNQNNPSKYGVNPYESSINFNGKNVSYMLGLTESDLKENNIKPGKWESVWNNLYLPIEQPKQKLISQKEHDHAMYMLETEGYGYEEEIKDNTPYMKGDDCEF